MVELRTNRASGTLSGGITNVAVSLTLGSGQGALFPNPNTAIGEYFWAVLEQGSLYAPTLREIVKCTARAGDVLTIVRAQQSTTAQAFSNGDRVELRMTQDSLVVARNRVVEANIYARYTPPTGIHSSRGSIDDPFGLFGGANIAGAPTLALGSQLSQQHRVHWSSTATAVGTRGQAGDSLFRGNAAGLGGFHVEGKVGLDLNIDGTRIWVGFNDATTALLINSINPGAAVTNALFGFGFDDTSLAASGNLRFFRNAGSGGPVTDVDTGISRVSMLTNIIHFMVHADPNASSIRIIIKDLVTGNGLDQVVSTNLPPATTGLVWQFGSKGNGSSNTAQLAVVDANIWPFGRPFVW